MSYRTEFSKIKALIDGLSNEELDDILFKCGIEKIRPSVESDYVRCLRKRLAEREYCKEVQKYSLNEEYFNIEIVGQEVA